jgi:hypothetical protein
MKFFLFWAIAVKSQKIDEKIKNHNFWTIYGISINSAKIPAKNLTKNTLKRLKNFKFCLQSEIFYIII